MCRYAQHNYKNTYGCFNCQIGFKRRNLYDVDPEAKTAKDFHCPNCRVIMTNLGRDLRLPKKEENEQWQCIKYLVDHNYNIYSCGCQGIGFVPHKMQDAIELVKNSSLKDEKYSYEQAQREKQEVLAKNRKKNAEALKTKLLLREIKKAEK